MSDAEDLAAALQTLITVEWPDEQPPMVTLAPDTPVLSWVMRGRAEQLEVLRGAVRAVAAIERVRGELEAARRKTHRLMGWRDHITDEVALVELRRFAVANPDVPLELFALHMIAYVDQWEELTAITSALRLLLSAPPVEAVPLCPKGCGIPVYRHPKSEVGADVAICVNVYDPAWTDDRVARAAIDVAANTPGVTDGDAAERALAALADADPRIRKAIHGERPAAADA